MQRVRPKPPSSKVSFLESLAIHLPADWSFNEVPCDILEFPDEKGFEFLSEDYGF